MTQLVSEPLFLACTRPAMVLGAPMAAVGCTAMVSAALFLAGGSLAWLLAAPALHLVCREICRNDPNAFRVLRVWLDTRGRSPGARRLGGASLSPLTQRRCGARP